MHIPGQCWAWVTSAPFVFLATNPSKSFLIFPGVSSAMSQVCALALRIPENLVFPSSISSLLHVIKGLCQMRALLEERGAFAWLISGVS